MAGMIDKITQSQTRDTRRAYRPDIDGLRAIAVLSVLFFHAGLQRFTGGYVGVDVFFVISGYLITKLLKEQIEAGTFSFGTFYLRRARRLFPAMFATSFITAVAAFLLFAPPYLERFGGELIHAVASVSNVFFWLEADYFDAAAKLKPLLHTWSLGVEEQFYLIWPLLLVLALKVRGRWAAPAVLVAVSVASLLANDAAVGGSAVIIKGFADTGMGQLLASTGLPGGKTAIYFLLPFRVFEFGFGAIVVWLEMFQPRRRWTLDVLMTIGLALVGYSVLAFNEHTLFPWFNAVIPCAGTALMIYAGRDSHIGKLVGLASGVGKISYSVYLVHWPLIVFTEYWLIDPPRNGVKNGMIAASIILGWLLYRFVETPFRQPKAKAKPVPGMISTRDAAFAMGMFASAALLFLVGSNMWKFDGWKWRVNERYAYSKAEFHTKFWGG
ncbi:MAG: acyltransferase, partial [Paraburkholderia sp.]